MHGWEFSWRMHRWHHSTNLDEGNRNYGQNLLLWDQLFGTYIAQPAHGHDRMKIGLANYRAPSSQTIGAMLMIPISEPER